MIQLDIKQGEISKVHKPSQSKEDLLKSFKDSKSLSPSGFPYWSICSGFVYSKSKRLSPAALKGIKEHDKAYNDILSYLKGNELLEFKTYSYSDFVTKKIWNIEDGTVWLEFPFYNQYKDKFHTIGFVDFAYLVNDILTIVDYKTGAFEVSPVENLQLALYALLIGKGKYIKFGIHQNNKYSEWLATPKFMEIAKHKLKKTLDILKQGEIEYVYNKKTCDSCFNRGNCLVYYDNKNKTLEEGL